MAKAAKDLFEVECPCCQASLRIDPKMRAVITYKAKERPPSLADFETAVSQMRGEEARREEAFRKSVEEEKSHKQVLSRKFDELLKEAKANPDESRPLRDIDID